MKAPHTVTPLGALAQKTRRTMFYAGLFSFALNMLMLVMPIYSLQVLDRVISSSSVETLVMLTLITCVGLIFYGVFTALRSFLLNGVSEWIDYTLAPKLLSEAISRSAAGTPTQAGQYQRDLGSIKTFVTGGPLTTFFDAPWSFIFILVIYMIHPLLGFICVIGLITMVGFGVLNELAVRKATAAAHEHTVRSQTLADTASRNAEAIESMGMMDNIVASWKKAMFEATRFQSTGTKRGALVQAVSRVVRMLIQTAVTGVGGYMALQNELTVGGMIASSILVGRALAPFENAIAIWKTMITARDAWGRLNKALGGKHLERGTVPLPAPRGLLTVEGLYFTPPQGKPILKNIAFTLDAGESLGIIGPSAAGKSTLSKLIMGLLPPTHGAVRLDGAETFKWNRADFGRYVGYLPQHVDLFDGTIKDNIARMDTEAPMDRVIEAAMEAGVHEMILRLPKGYETECGPGNLSLSPGQRQRVGMARAIYNNPRFVVLDEPNSNLDSEGERALIETLKLLKSRGVTFVVVAHRPTIVSVVDGLIVMRDGMIERMGPREEVLKRYTAPPIAGPQAATGRG